MAAQKATAWDAHVEAEHIIALLAPLAGRRGKFQKARVIGAPCCARDVQEEEGSGSI
jgi:hypothetical protein